MFRLTSGVTLMNVASIGAEVRKVIPAVVGHTLQFLEANDHHIEHHLSSYRSLAFIL